MAKVIDLGLLPADDPLFKEPANISTPMVYRKADPNSPTSVGSLVPLRIKSRNKDGLLYAQIR